MTITLEFIQGNTYEGIRFPITDGDGNAIDITGATVVLTVNDPDFNTLIFTRTITNTNPTGGIAEYQPIVGSTDFTKVGLHAAELKITFSSGLIGRVQDMFIDVTKRARNT